MTIRKPRSKATFIRVMKGLKISKAAKDIIAAIGVEFDLIAYEGLKELRADMLATLQQVDIDLREHDTEYQHVTSPELRDAVKRCIKKLR